MKNSNITRLLLLCITLLGSSAQAQIVAWDFNSQLGNQITSPATTADANLTVSPISRGSGLSPSALNNAFSSNTNGTSLGDGFTANSLANAIAQNAFLQFTITANTGFQVSLTVLNANFRRSANGPTDFQWQYSFDGFVTPGVNISSSINFTSTATNGVSQAAIDLSTITALQNVPSTTTITIRLYGWNASATGGTFALGRLTGDDLAIDGTVTPAGPSPYSGPPSGVVDATTYSNVTFTSSGAFPAGANITVNDTLKLNDHVINLNGGSITMGATGTVLPGIALPSTSDVGRVFGGNFIHDVATVTGAKVFPLGTSTSRRYAAVDYTVAPTTAGTLTGFSTEGNAPSQNFSGILPVAVSAPFFWTLNAGGGLAGGTYNFALTADNVPGVLNASQLRIVKRPTGGGPWTIQGTFNTSTFLSGTVAIAYTGLSGFSEFSIASDPVDNPLPVELSSFTGSTTAAGVNLRWTTQSELNNAGFAVFRNGEEIASYRFSPTLRGKGTTTGATNYAFLDAGVEVGQRYTYRLRSFDLDGTIHDYPQTVSVEVREPISQRVFNYDLSQNFPNPFNPTTSIKYSIREAGNVSLKVYDLLGREVLTLVNQVQAPGEYQVSFDASNLAASGMYIYRLQSGSFTRTMKMLLVK